MGRPRWIQWLLVIVLAGCGRVGIGRLEPDAGKGMASIAPTIDARKRPLGEHCKEESECASGFCANGVCCNSECSLPCQQCTLLSSLGRCTFVAAGVPPEGTAACPKDSPESCGYDGLCDGRGACRRYVRGSTCQALGCQDSRTSQFRACDGEGSCDKIVTLTCDPYGCDSALGLCSETCDEARPCAIGKRCVEGACLPSRTNNPCQRDQECLSGYCVDGVCCNGSCEGACVGCNLPGQIGRCTYIPAGSVSPRAGDCPVSADTPCGHTGTCDGWGSCARAPKGIACGATCLDGGVAVCDGRGACVSGNNEPITCPVDAH